MMPGDLPAGGSSLAVIRLDPDPLPIRYIIRDREEPQTTDEFLGTVTNLIRFRILTPERGYVANVSNVLSGMRSEGYEVDAFDNLWRRSRYPLLRVRMTDPSGTRLEVHFPTPASHEASTNTNLDFQLLHAHAAEPTLRLQALAMILQGNLDAGVRAPDTTGLPDPVDQSPAAFFSMFRALAQGYLTELRRLGLSVHDHLTGCGFSTPVASMVEEALGAAQGRRPPQEMMYYEVTSRLRPAPSNLFVVEPSTTPTRAIRFDHPTKTWSFDPLTVEATLLEAFDEAEDRISNVERERADAVADLLGRPLPTEQQLRQLMESASIEATRAEDPGPPEAPQSLPGGDEPDERRTVMLRQEHHQEDWRYLWAYLDEAGNLHIDGQDLGPGTAIVSSDGEYEWFRTIDSADVTRVLELLGGRLDEGVLDVLERDYVGDGSYELERLLRESDVPSTLQIWSG